MNSRETQEASGKSQVPNRTLAKRISAIVQTKLFKNLQSPDSGCLEEPEPKRRRLSEDPNKYLPTTACASTNTDSLYSRRSTQKRKSEDLLNATTSKSPEDAVNRVSFNLKSSLRSEDDPKRKETYVDHNRTPGSPFYPGNTTYGGENWKCNVCQVRNDKRNSKCVCFKVEKPGKKKPEVTFNICLPTTQFNLGNNLNTINFGPMKSVNFEIGNTINSTNVLNFGGPSGKCESLTIVSQGNIRSAGNKINGNIISSGNNSINIFQGSNKGCNSLINLGCNLNTINFGPMKSVNFEIGNNINSTNVLNFGGPSGKCESLTIDSQGNIRSAGNKINGNIISSGNNSINIFQGSNKGCNSLINLGCNLNTINFGPMKSVNFEIGNNINSTNVLNFGGPSGKCESLTIVSQGNIRSAGNKINGNIISSGNNSINIFQRSNKGCNSLINLGSNLNTINFGPMKSVNFEIGNNINETNVLNFGGPSGKCESLTIVSQGNITSAGNIISSGNNSITTFQRSNSRWASSTNVCSASQKAVRRTTPQ